ncbi:MAG: glycerol-3-phosphate 1-O-acyltransferase PlsY [Okeania sp. SIO2G4]|uniref:glycerol-3-phosphate 1-O-acyltransferase PlsY n=1 Tax=unclassified Okeania TaxID=2634635 RepID=UPI0013BE3FEB|nr:MULTISPECIES: glycerol-3-phosphate 1-O-acyltransferase PlsY [unclassified Okeania]NEP07359.1 glycerol-3-phosphate 1-O-acyltransferase PlsY [Okeania sp. SIO4D6]NEP73590.1 glycerol-3-phosphate 1-O-acyltransferase PlsY [Okeania sp. SIO2G5]NEP94240.1 glycerol-3-phosphate 1-O-acyltransferase PlsY [Okeania sp. SIO2F5]NEQ93207.1 glycerol-3-phosphate 1-O-acyltransferase PlsY [Okeania sp. SIO2G4]
MISWLFLNGVILIIAYLLGATPSGYWIGSWFYGIDIREQGSGSTGATNVLRSIGKWPALVVLIIDILKGVLAIALVRYIYSLLFVQNLTIAAGIPDVYIVKEWMVILAGLIAIFGHTKSIWIGFKGGKSVASSLGILLAMSWVVGLGTLSVFAVFLAISRIVSLSSIIAAISVSGLMFFTGQPIPYEIFAITGGMYVIWRHRSNIERLLAGKEPRIGQKLSTES